MTDSGLPRLRLGLLGCGRVVERYHLPALQKSTDFTIVTACDAHHERREWVRQYFAQLPVFESSSEMLEQIALDAVLVATPPLTHCQLVTEALEMGTHVLVEKPMALTSSDARRMLETSLRVQRCLVVGFSRRFRSTYGQLQKRLAAVGREHIQAISFDISSDQGAWRSVSGFLGDDRQGGGVLDDMASHQFDLLPRLADQAIERVRVKNRIHHRDAEWIEYEAELDNGLAADCRVGHGSKRHDTLEIQLRDRTLLVHRNRFFETRLPHRWSHWYKLRVVLDSTLHKTTQNEDAVTLFEKQLRAFAAAVRSEKRPLMNDEAESGLRTVRAVEACRESLQCAGKWVSL
ncbi:MAG: Gfo/Idh/MocA family oxidoreductase [Gammaproteobacteria bacterium]|nr:Gfo/Idh/MocA family oxidoreductase [Gammaproteobacteria bacterium]